VTTRRLAKARPALLGCALLIAMPFLLLRAALSGQLVVAGLDLVTWIYPYHVAAARAMGEGRLPLWNPDLYGGVPFLANIQAGVLYPPNLLFVLFRGPQLITWLILLHLVLAGLLMYAFCRRALAVPVAGASIGALAFSIGGFAISQSDHFNQANTLAWMPGVLLAVDQAYRTRSRAWVAALGLMFALQAFAGGAQEQYYTALVAVAWLIVLLVRERKAGARQLALRLVRPLLGALLGVGMAAIQLIPTVELSHYGIRAGGKSLSDANLLALPFHDVIQSVVPNYTTALPTEWVGYVGLVPLLLGAVAVVRGWRDPVVLVLAGLAAVALLVALGLATPVFWLVYHVLPGFSFFRVPPRALLVFTFAAASLAAIGTGRLQRHDRRVWLVLPVAGAVFLAAFPIAWTLQHRSPLPVLTAFLPASRWPLLAAWLALIALASVVGFAARRWPAAIAGLVVLTGIELYAAAQPFDALKPLPASIYATDPLIDAVLPLDSGPFRGLSIAHIGNKTPQVPQSDLDRLGYRGDFRYANLASARVADVPNFPLQSGRATIDGYDGGLLPLTSYLRFRAFLLPAGHNYPDYPIVYLAEQIPDYRLLGLLGVRSIVRDAQPGSATDIEGVTIVDNPEALPRAFLVHTPRPSAGVDADLRAIAAPEFDLGHMVTIARGDCAGGQADTADQTDLLQNGAESLTIRVSSDSPGVLVIGNVDYPGWQARVDGNVQPVLLVDGLIQGVCLPAGQHTVTLRFTPSHWTLAIAISIVSLGLLFAFVIWGGLIPGDSDTRPA
jgi:hypothetical protein